MIAGRQPARPADADAVAGLLGIFVSPDRLAIEHDQTPAGEPAALGDDHALRALVRHAELGGDRIGRVLHRRRRSLGNADRALAVDEVRAPAGQARLLEHRLDGRLRDEVQRQDVVAARFRPPELLQLGELSGFAFARSCPWLKSSLRL